MKPDDRRQRGPATVGRVEVRGGLEPLWPPRPPLNQHPTAPCLPNLYRRQDVPDRRPCQLLERLSRPLDQIETTPEVRLREEERVLPVDHHPTQDVVSRRRVPDLSIGLERRRPRQLLVRRHLILCVLGRNALEAEIDVVLAGRLDDERNNLAAFDCEEIRIVTGEPVTESSESRSLCRPDRLDRRLHRRIPHRRGDRFRSDFEFTEILVGSRLTRKTEVEYGRRTTRCRRQFPVETVPELRREVHVERSVGNLTRRPLTLDELGDVTNRPDTVDLDAEDGLLGEPEARPPPLDAQPRDSRVCLQIRTEVEEFVDALLRVRCRRLHPVAVTAYSAGW